MIDLLRGYPPAVAWFTTRSGVPPFVPGFVVLELMAGCNNTFEMHRLRKWLRQFRVCWPTAQDCDRALTTFARGHLSHNLGILDALIGECAVGLGIPLVTFNVKHFRAITALTIEQPYGRG